MRETGKPQFTQSMTCHLNGGNKFSQLDYEIKRDGKPCGVSRHTVTNGSPRYIKTRDVFVCGQDEFDVLATKGDGLLHWLETVTAPSSAEPTTTPTASTIDPRSQT